MTIRFPVTDTQGNRTDALLPVTVDRTAVVQAVIDAAPDGTEQNPNIVTLAGSYLLNGTLEIEERNWLIIDATGLTMFRSELSNSFVHIRGCVGITWNGGVAFGPHTGYGADGVRGQYNPDYAFQHGIHLGPLGSNDGMFTECTDITIDGFRCRDIGGDYIYISSALYGPQGNRTPLDPERVIVRNCIGEKNGRQGVGVVGGDDILIEDNTFVATRTGIDLENVHGAITNCVIQRNALHTRNGAVNAQSSNINCNGIVIRDNVAVGPGIRCTSSAGTHRFNWTVQDNIWPSSNLFPPTDVYPSPGVTGGGAEGALMWFKYTDGVVIDGNYFRVGLKRVQNRTVNGAVRLDNVNGIAITNNDFRGNNQLVLEKGPYTGVVEAGNTGIWESPIGTFEPYPAEYDPNVDRAWTMNDFPQLNPPPFNTVGWWDTLIPGAQL